MMRCNRKMHSLYTSGNCKIWQSRQLCLTGELVSANVESCWDVAAVVMVGSAVVVVVVVVGVG